MMKWVKLILWTAAMWTTIFLGRPEAKAGHFLEAGLLYYSFDYEEELSFPFKSTEEGWLQGFQLAYLIQGGTSPFSGRLLFEYTDDETDFDGTTQAGQPVKDQTDDTLINWEGNLGVTLKKGKASRWTLMAYTGLGYRYWERTLGGRASFSEEYSWQYLPIGLRGDYRIDDRWTGALDLSVRFMFGGEIQVNFSDIDPGFSDPSVKLGNKTGYRVQAPFEYELRNGWIFVLTPWFEDSAIGKSDTFVTTFNGVPALFGFEPSSDTDQFGLNLSVRVPLSSPDSRSKGTSGPP